MRRRAKRDNSVARFFTAVPLLFLGGMVFLAIWLWQGKPETPYVSLFIGDPMAVAVFQGEPERFVLLIIPADVQVEGIYGAGKYSLESLWKLGHIDKQKPDLLRGSLAEAAGVPIDRVISTESENLSGGIGTLDELAAALKPISWPGRILHPRTSIALREIIWMWWLYRQVDLSTARVIDFSSAGVLSKTELPDKTITRAIDPAALDRAIGNSLEEIALRREAVSVALYNTTTVPLVGQRIARMLEHIGIHVVSLANDTLPVAVCELSGTKKQLASKTAHFLARYFRCLAVPVPENGPADLILRIGTDYSRRFMPQ